MTKDEKQAALDAALKGTERSFGKDVVMCMGEKVDTQISTVLTGSLTLDAAIGVGGYPRGRIVEIYRPESSGRTTVALHAVAEVQERGGTTTYIDAENAVDPAYAKTLGVDIDSLILSQPDTGEKGLQIADTLIASGAIDILVVNSVTVLVPRAEVDGEVSGSYVGLQARLMSQALRKLSGNINKAKTIAIFINQIRERVGVMFDNPETIPGGRVLKLCSTIRLEVRHAEQIRQSSDVMGNRVKVKVVKNKVAPPFKVAEVDIVYGKGISQSGELLDMTVGKGIVDKTKSWYSHKEDRVGQGQEDARRYLGDHPDIYNKIMIQIREAYGIDVKSLEEKEDPAKVKEKIKQDEKGGEKANKK